MLTVDNWRVDEMVDVLCPTEAVRAVPAEACVGLGGSVNTGHPMALVRALARAGVTDLSIVGLTSGLDLDLLVAAGVVASVSAAYVGAEDIAGIPPALRWAAETGRVRVWEYEEGIHLAALRARAQRQPYATWTGALGTAVADHPLVERAFDERSGMHYLKVRPLAVDVALLWAEAADEHGSVLMWGGDLGDEALRAAAAVRIVQVERLVPTEYLSRHADRVAPWSADIVVRAPLSTHPFGGSALSLDERWLRGYVEIVREARRFDEPGRLDRFVDEWLRDPPDEDAYLARVGIDRLRELMC